MKKTIQFLYKRIFRSLCAFVLLAHSFPLFAQNFQTLTLPPIPPDSLQALQADENNFAYPFYVSLDVKQEASTWIAGDSVHYALIIVSPGAYSLNVIFDDFFLPQGSQLALFNAGKQQREIATRSPYPMFASPLISGDTMILHIQEPLENSRQSRFRIGQISHGFKDVGISALRLKSNDCHININCPQAEAWKTQKQSVCRLVISGKRYCTGTMINNTSYDGTPYVLTANHCIANSSEAITTLFYFNHEYSDCASTGTLPINFNISGSELIATGKDKLLDFSLLKLPYKPSEEFNVYYSGWNIGTSQKGEGCVHHPAGTAKRLALNEKALDTKTFEGAGTNFIKNSHWFISEWARGTTEGGSSGSALLNPNKQVIGVLTGGESNCESPKNDYFQQISFAWNYFSEPRYQLKAWLDPINSGTTICDGYFPYGHYEASNIVLTDSITELNFGKKATGSWTSSNEIGWTAFADKFLKINNSTIYGIHILGKIDMTQNLNDIKFCVWEGNETPTKKLWSRTFDESMIVSKNHVLIPVYDSLEVSQNCWIGYEARNNSTAFTAFLAAPRSFGNTYFVYSPAQSSWIASADLGAYTSMAIQLQRTNNIELLPPIIDDTAPEFIKRLRSKALSHTSCELFGIDSIAVFSAQTTMFTLASNDVSNWSGTNEMNMTCFANKIRNTNKQLITGITAGINTVGNPGNTTTFYLWNSDLSEILSSIEIDNSRLHAKSANRIYFPQFIAVADSFHIGVCYNRNQLNETNSLFLVYNDTTTIDASFFAHSEWTKYSNFKLNYNLALQPITACSRYLFNPNPSAVSYYPLPRQESITIAENADCKIYPQPASDSINIQFLNTMFQSIDYALIDLHGSLVWSGSAANTGGVHKIPLWQLRNGVYILHITAGNSSRRVKIVKGR